MRAAIYARYSTENQSKDSIADQVRECTDKAKREGFTVVAEFTDAAISGGTSDRPGYQAMLEAGKRREFDIIVAEDMKRLWREQAEQWRAIKEWIDHDIAFLTVSGIDSRQPNFEMIASVMGAGAELERKETAFRTRRGLKGKALAGTPTGGRTYGYTSRNEPVEAEAVIVREIFERYAAGESQRAIARDLNARGVPSPGASWKRTKKRTDGAWVVSGVHALLRNEMYLGRLIWGASRWRRSARDSKKRTRIELPRSEWTITEKPEIRLVEQGTWEQVRARDTPATYGSSNARPKYPLSGLLVCAECNTPMTLAGGTNSRGYGGQRYVCATRRHHGPQKGIGCSNGMTVSRQIVEELLIEPFRDRLLDDKNFLAAITSLKNFEFRKYGGENSTRHTGAERAIDFGGYHPPGGNPQGDPDLLAARISAIESAAALGAMSQRDATARVTALRNEAQQFKRSYEVPQDQASLLANVERLRAALISAATDALRDALRRTLGTVRCTPVHDDGTPYLRARFEGGDTALLDWLCIAGPLDTQWSSDGLAALVAGASNGRGIRLK